LQTGVAKGFENCHLHWSCYIFLMDTNTS